MADLSAYINFSVRLDYTQNKILLTDTGTYLAGVDVNLVGKFDITHPDLIPEVGSWTLPDVTYVSGALTTSLRDLRRSSTNLPQTGNYTITYTIDHPDYTPTVLSRTFNFQYVPVAAVVTEGFDVFTPLLELVDETVYTVANFNSPTITRAWSVVAGTLGTVTGSTSTLDLAVSGDYYDATYVGTLLTTLIYQHSTLSYLSVKDSVGYSVDTSANTPPDTCSLLAFVNALKERADLLANTCQPYTEARATWQYATSLYMLILQNLLASTTDNVTDYVDELLVLYYNAVPNYTNTNTIIPPYTFCYPQGSILEGIYSSPYSSVYA